MKVKTKSLQIENLDLDSDFARQAQKPFAAKVQELIDANKPVRIIVLKARQMGISTVTEAILLNWCFINPGPAPWCCRRRPSTPSTCSRCTKLSVDNWPFRSLFPERATGRCAGCHGWRPVEHEDRQAKGEEVGRGDTIHAVHRSEVAFYPDPETLFTSLNQAVPDLPGTIIILESTANGAGDWSTTCGTVPWPASRLRPHVLPLVDPRRVRHPQHDAQPQPASEGRARLMDKHPEIGLPQLAWRRWCIVNKCNSDLDKFKQEYPADPDEAFLVTGRNRFPSTCSRSATPSGTGPPASCRRSGTRPSPRASSTRTRPASSPSSRSPGPARSTWWWPTRPPDHVGAIRPASRCSTAGPTSRWLSGTVTLEPADLADRIAELGYYYNTATVNCEIEGGGPGHRQPAHLEDVLPRRVALATGRPDTRQPLEHLRLLDELAAQQMAAGFLIDIIGQGMLKLHGRGDLRAAEGLRAAPQRASSGRRARAATTMP